jgi:two-component system cell cycle response regulator
MRQKILTVDDSKTVRIIVRKAFKNFDCDILEAANGVEGLAVAAKEMPALILLDVTMPVMDGVEMLTKLKADPQLKGIPVIMLTAEGGRDNVLRIAKIGVRDYLVKPFKEEVLIEKSGRVIELQPTAIAGAKAKTLVDPATLLVVEDKPTIIQQIQEGLKHTPWTVVGVGSQAEAVEFCLKSPPDLVMISLSLRDEAAFSLFRLLRNNPKSKYTPIFGLVVKTDTSAQVQAQQVGFTTLVTKPIDLAELETKVAKGMNLDTSQRYFAGEGDCIVMRLPETCTPGIVAEISGYTKPKLAQAVDAGHHRAVIDLHLLKALHMGVIKLLVQTMQTCRELGMQYALVGNPQIIAECKGFEETSSWAFHGSVEEAKASFGTARPAPAQAPVLAAV